MGLITAWHGSGVGGGGVGLPPLLTIYDVFLFKICTSHTTTSNSCLTLARPISSTDLHREESVEARSLSSTMPRRVKASTKQKKIYLQDKRAVKRGELDASDLHTVTEKPSNPKSRFQKSDPRDGEDVSRRLQSKFVTVSPEYLERTRNLAHSDPLIRPIPHEYALFPVELLERDKEKRLTCPSRPKFRYDMTKKEVEKNEEGWFKKWMKSTDEIMDEWIDGEPVEEPVVINGGGQDEVEKKASWPRSVSWFETNLEVWRQL